MTRWFVVAAMLAACAGPIDPGEQVDAGAEPPVDAAVATPGEMSIARAEEWVAVQVHYCQAPNHTRDADAACSSTCTRYDNPAWDLYRSDCSGFVSWAWDLAAPGRITSQFAPFKSDLTHTIIATDLRPGDAVNNMDHMMLFKEWITQPTKAAFIEEPGCSSATPYAHEFTATVMTAGMMVAIVGHGTFTAIRYDEAP